MKRITYAILVVTCLANLGCDRCTEQHQTIAVRIVPATDRSPGACVMLLQLETDAATSDMSRRIRIMVLTEDRSDTIQSLEVENVSTDSGACSMKVCEIEPEGTRGVIVSLADATSTYGARRGYCFLAYENSWCVVEIPRQVFDITDRDGNGRFVIESTQGGAATLFGVRSGLLTTLDVRRPGLHIAP
jgi:hypothetical protein